jgi:hypothetical protein
LVSCRAVRDFDVSNHPPQLSRGADDPVLAGAREVVSGGQVVLLDGRRDAVERHGGFVARRDALERPGQRIADGKQHPVPVASTTAWNGLYGLADGERGDWCHYAASFPLETTCEEVPDVQDRIAAM